ncbi:MAG: hypothetical protein AAB525_02525 [Patescibacteria group bacterium]
MNKEQNQLEQSHLTKEKTKTFIAEIDQIPLSIKIQTLINRYNETALHLFAEPRKEFIWKWLKSGVEQTMLDCVDQELKEKTSELIQESIAVVVFIDDIVDQMQEERFLTDALAIVGNGEEEQKNVLSKQTDSFKKDYLVLIKDAWNDLTLELRNLPRFMDFKPDLKEAYGELWKAFWQALDLKTFAKHQGTDLLHLGDEDTIGKVEKRLSYNMHIVIGNMIMLMGSSKFEKIELKSALEFFLYDQVAGNLENDWHTFPIELKQGDFASALILYAIDKGYITAEEIEQIAAHPENYNGLQKLIKTVREKCEDYIRDKRLRLLEMRAKIGREIKSFDAGEAIRRSFAAHKNMHEQLGNFIALLK